MVNSETPYTEENLEGNSYIRTFSDDTLDEELKWHWDEEDRVVSPIHPTDWMFQMDNELPKLITTETYIPAGAWHRLIKGTGNLSVKVVKLGNK